MAGNRERRRFRDSAIRAYERPYEEASMSDPKEPLSLEEAEGKSRSAADQLTDLLNQADTPPNSIDDEMYAKLNSLFMSFLAKKYAIAPPDYARIDIDNE